MMKSKQKSRSKAARRSRAVPSGWRPDTVLILSAALLLGIPVLTVSILAFITRDTTAVLSLVAEMFVPLTLVLGGFLMNMRGRR